MPTPTCTVCNISLNGGWGLINGLYYCPPHIPKQGGAWPPWATTPAAPRAVRTLDEAVRRVRR